MLIANKKQKMIFPSKEFIEVFKSTPGALSVAESIAIMNIASQAPEGLFVEYGSYKGKSAMSAMYGLPKGKMYCYEPDLSTGKIIGEELSRTLLSVKSNVYEVNLSARYSTDVIQLYDNYSYVFIDSGSHCDGLAQKEVKLLEDRVGKGGVVAFHDYLNQFSDPAEAMHYLIDTGKYEKIEIDWQTIFDYVKENDLETGNDSWHQYPDLGHPPNFVGAVRRK